MQLPALPILEALPRLHAALRAHAAAVLQAPPGAGKSTLVPLALLDEPWLAGRRILMLEPRRIAARSVAGRMARLLGEAPGGTIGYRTRLDTRVGPRTRIEVVTEGILTRMLQDDPALEDCGLVIFDEFHERSLEADLGLALCLDARTHLREDLRLLVMSATLQGTAVAALLGDAPLVHCEGQSHPVTTHFRDRPASGRPEADPMRALAATVAVALEADDGDLLVFLPGLAEIHRTARLLGEREIGSRCEILALHGSLPVAEQDAILAGSPSGRRRIVLATNVAETSLTIERIRVVVDSGLERRSVFDPGNGMSQLVTCRIARASADQRRGRAGRVGPGCCYRLWTQAEHDALPAESPADVLIADLAPLALELAAWGVVDPTSLRWLDAPPRATFEQARALLSSLGAVDGSGRITAHGRRMVRVGAHPRVAHMLLEAAELGHARVGAEIAALLGERDVLRGRAGAQDVDLRSRLDALHARGPSGDRDIDAPLRQRILRSASLLERRLGSAGQRAPEDSDTPGRLLATAYPDRIAQARGGDGRWLLSGGRGAQLVEPQLLGRSDYLVVAELDGGGRDARIRLAAPISLAAIEDQFAAAIVTVDRVEWHDRELGVVAFRERRLGALVLERRRIDDPDTDAVQQALFAGLRAVGIDALKLSREARALQARVEFVRHTDDSLAAELPACDDATLLAELEHWLGPWTRGLRRLADLARLDLHTLLLGRLDCRQRQRLDALAPSHFVLPSGSRLPIDYSGSAPTLSARLQELFGMTTTPRLAGGRVPLAIELLSPARRPVQITRDLESFWTTTYHEVRRELAGRYPRHFWPEDPLAAPATARAKPRKR